MVAGDYNHLEGDGRVAPIRAGGGRPACTSFLGSLIQAPALSFSTSDSVWTLRIGRPDRIGRSSPVGSDDRSRAMFSHADPLPRDPNSLDNLDVLLVTPTVPHTIGVDNQMPPSIHHPDKRKHPDEHPRLQSRTPDPRNNIRVRIDDINTQYTSFQADCLAAFHDWAAANPPLTHGFRLPFR